MTAARLLAAVLMMTGCSTVAQPPPETCEIDEDCGDGHVCVAGGICQDAELVAPLADLGFEIFMCSPDTVETGACELRTELRGCDQELRDDPASSGLLVRRDALTEPTDLRFEVQYATTPDNPAPKSAEITVSQPSRLQRGPMEVSVQSIVPVEDPPLLRFPFFDRRDFADAGKADIRRAMAVEIVPEEENLAPVFDMLLRKVANEGRACTPGGDPSQCPRGSYCLSRPEGNFCSPLPATDLRPYRASVSTPADCHRSFQGLIKRVDDGALVSGGAIEMTFRHPVEPQGRLGIPPIRFSTLGVSCDADADCLSGMFCDPERDECVLDLAGRRASRQFASAETSGAFSNVPVYTYCELEPEPLQSRRLTLLTQSGARGLPQMSFTYEQPLPETASETVQLPAHVCLPDWTPPQPLQVEIEGPTVTLARGAEGRWTCCDTECLPTNEDALPPTSTPLSCAGTAGGVAPRLRFQTVLPAEATEGWEALGCLRPDVDGGIAGRVTRVNSTCADPEEPCVQELSPGLDDAPQEYTLRIEPPAGSVVASTEVSVSMTPDPEPLEVELQRRPLLTGRVVLPPTRCAEADGDGDCGAERAVVMAERLHLVREESSAVLGPFFYQTTTSYDPDTMRQGRYVLPLEPGVYVITALPAGRSIGAPARFQLVDLRDGRDQTVDLPLTEGVLVRLQMNGFNRNVTVLPLDTGSWVTEPDLADMDLNSPDACYRRSGATTQGCRIRTLVPQGRLFPDLSERVQFFARERRGATHCEPGTEG